MIQYSVSSPADATTNDASKPNSNAKRISRLGLCGRHQVYTKNFENIFKSYKAFYIIVVTVNVKAIGASHQVPFEPIKKRDLVCEQAVEMVLRMQHGVELLCVAVAVKRG
jgi:hypothetical protein